MFIRRLLCLSALGLAAICPQLAAAHAPAKVEFNNVDISDAKCCQDFRLMDDRGRSRSLADFRGKVVILTFGFTKCPDVCPMTMASLKKALARLGRDAEKVQVLFVTLDPARDSGPVLRKYLDSFDRSFIGLRGDRRSTARTAKDFRVFFKKAQMGTASAKDYVIDHTLGSYLFDADGRPQVFVANGKTDLLVSDLEKLLHGAGRLGRSS